MKRLGVVCLVVAAAVGIVGSSGSAASEEQVSSVLATFEGQTIRLADGWGEATACVTDGQAARCYRSEQEMDRVEGDGAVARASCSTNLRLYSATSYGGSVLAISARFENVNLADHGFNNVTSSYRVGACSAQFFDTTGGSGLYPGSTNAGVSASSMVSGWDNRVGSVYIA